MGQGEEGHGAGHYSFAFEHPKDALRWFGAEGLTTLYNHGYRVKEVPASKVYRSESGRQVFFEHHPSADPQKAKDARDFLHPTPSSKKRKSIQKSDAAQWRSRPVLRAEDAQDLDHAAAARSLSSGSAQEGERQAYEEYSRQQRLDAMAHHFRQAGEAQKRGDRPTSERHMLAYAGHARALGIDPAGHPPPEVGERIRQLAGKRAAFRGHPADRLA